MSLKNPVTPPGIDPGTFRLVAKLDASKYCK